MFYGSVKKTVDLLDLDNPYRHSRCAVQSAEHVFTQSLSATRVTYAEAVKLRQEQEKLKLMKIKAESTEQDDGLSSLEELNRLVKRHRNGWK